MIRFGAIFGLLIQQIAAAMIANKPTACQPVYGIRFGPSGAVEKVIDSARCVNADASFIQMFLEEMKTRLNGPLLDLEIVNCTLPRLGSNFFPLGLRRLTIQHSELESIDDDCFVGQENVLEDLNLSYNRLNDIPLAISNMTVLAHLDLSHNSIRSLPQGSVFFHLLKLRHLNLDYNNLGFLNRHRGANQSVSMTFFNIEPLREHIESISLADNNLTAFPEQFSRFFGRLQRLDLSSNNFKRIVPGSFAQMPLLRRLSLDNNQLSELPELKFTTNSLEKFSLRGNPIRCDCGAVWLWDWLQQPSDKEKLALDNCREERWQGRALSDLPSNYCDPMKNRTAAEAVKNEAFEDVIRSVNITITPASHYINVSLQFAGENTSDLKWTISHREFGAEKSGTLAYGDLRGHLTHSVTGLKASTGYHVCTQLLGIPGSRCQEVLTLPEAETRYPVTETAIAATVSTSTTLFVVVLVCCCCPRFKRSRNERDAHSKSALRREEARDEKKPTTVSMSAAVLDSWYDPAPALREPSHRFSTFLSGSQQPQPPPTSNEESRKKFLATCHYLRQRALDPSKGTMNANQASNGSMRSGRQRPERPPLSDINRAVTAQPQCKSSLRPRNSLRSVRPDSTVYFNSTYGLAEFQSPSGANPYKYCTWRPSRAHKRNHPLSLSGWTSYPDFLANSSDSPLHLPGSSLQLHQLATRPVPVYTIPTAQPGRPSNQASRLYWSAAPVPIHSTEMQF